MKRDEIQEGLPKRYPIPDYAKDGDSIRGSSMEEFERGYERTFGLENEDKSIHNPYHEKAKLNKKERDKLPKIFPLKGGREKDPEKDKKQGDVKQVKRIRINPRNPV